MVGHRYTNSTRFTSPEDEILANNIEKIGWIVKERIAPTGRFDNRDFFEYYLHYNAAASFHHISQGRQQSPSAPNQAVLIVHAHLV